jgi:hypothetical protein
MLAGWAIGIRTCIFEMIPEPTTAEEWRQQQQSVLERKELV